MAEQEINYEFKIVYCIAILLVISGHFGSSTLSVHGLFQYDTFHVPLFLFASGYFFRIMNAENLDSVQHYIIKKVLKLIFPYYIWNIIYCIIGHLLNTYTIMNINSESKGIGSFFVEPFLKGVGSGYNVAAWFLPALFLVQLSYVGIRFCLKKVRWANEYVIILILLLIAVGGVLLGKSEANFICKVMIVRTAYLLFWYGGGYFYRLKLQTYTRRINNIVAITIIVAITAFLHFFVERGIEVRSIIFEAQFNPNVLYVFLRAFLGIAFWMRISYVITPILKDSSVMLYIGNHTFSLMMHQGIAGIIINAMVYKIAPTLIDVEKFTTKIWYHFTSSNRIRLIYVFLIPLMILTVIYGFDCIRDKFEYNKTKKQCKNIA